MNGPVLTVNLILPKKNVSRKITIVCVIVYINEGGKNDDVVNAGGGVFPLSFFPDYILVFLSLFTR